jgi:hypothetical protein
LHVGVAVAAYALGTQLVRHEEDEVHGARS